ncbi:RAMP superfamily CRISPR-associated protein [Phytohabitans aurantiacus]|uniref:CRISPR-associated RAMP family protein n=1 Tax=Phytohabitans aurantiacus TaxID=3016789 RepID=A0ABQ5R403_9ACTN|nr:RAMP superfamily CRISPR-associated protein [Phytohabitans aurantiacus]GLI00907.1 hypothetical protein Pa4123_61830 [Phytohabitans aurantiacus]
MAEVVVLSWEPQSRLLAYVPVDTGNGGGVVSVTVAEGFAAAVSEQCAKAPLPRVGELEAKDEFVLLEVSGPAVTRCSARWHRGQIRLWSRVRGDLMGEVRADAVGLTDPELAQQPERIGSFLLFAEPVGGVVGCWECDGGLSGWLRRVRARRAEAAAEKAIRRAAADAEQAQEEAKRRFINPYTFVPFPAAIERAAPAGHHALAEGRLCGTFRVRFECTSPLQAPEGAVSGQRLRLAGASVKGSVRSLHETLAGGCLRVLDEEFVPSYRDAAAVPAEQWTLAVVEEVARDGQPLAVRLCDPVVWVRAEQLRGAWGRQLATGSRVSFDPSRKVDNLDRYELPDDERVECGGDWAVLLTDAGARRPETKLKKPGSYFAACGRVGGDDALREVAESAWQEFRRAVAGAREVTKQRATERAGEVPPGWLPVTFRGQEIGSRKAVTGSFDRGDVLWVRRDGSGEGVDGLRLAAIWRHAGAGPMGSRVPAHLHACPPRQEGAGASVGTQWPEVEEELLLCPSCRLFGAADTMARGAGETARQRAYAGHVRIGDAVSPTPVELTPFRRAPLGAPRPGAGQFYLRYDNTAPAATRTALPTREWGAQPDTTGKGLRPVRGRKFYWHADPTVQDVPRHIARGHQLKTKGVEERALAPAGTVLECHVTFDNLSESELGGLLATFQPDRAVAAAGIADGPLRLHLGGGKPLGLGSCRASVSELRVWSARSRYGDADPVTAEPGRYVAAFVGSVPAEVTATWPALAAVLAADTVDPARVWYPPGAHWPDQRNGEKRFDEPFAFFVGTSGMHMATKGKKRPLQPLPDPTGPDQSLTIVRSKDLDKGSHGR